MEATDQVTMSKSPVGYFPHEHKLLVAITTNHIVAVTLPENNYTTSKFFSQLQQSANY